MKNTKICSKCGRELPLTEFSKLKHSKDGLNAWCKECQRQYKKQYDAEHVEKKTEYMKQYRAEHADEIVEYIKQWKTKHKAEIAEYNKQYYATIEGYAKHIRHGNLRADREQGRCGKNEDPLPSLEYYIWALQQPDFYDGKHYHWSEMGLDRIYNDKPHTIANVVPCSTVNNIRRRRKPFEEFCKIMKNNMED